MFAHEGVFPPLQGRWPFWCMPCGRRWRLSSTTCTEEKHQHDGLQPLQLHKCSSKSAMGPVPATLQTTPQANFDKKAPRAPVQQELTQHTKVAWMCDIISANKLAFNGTGSSFSEKRHGIQCSHTKAFFLPYKDVGLSGACCVAGGGA